MGKSLLIDSSFFEGRAATTLTAALGPGGIGWCVAFWRWVVANCKDIQRMPEHGPHYVVTPHLSTIESELDWDGPPGRLLAILVESGVIELVNGHADVGAHFFSMVDR